MYTLYRVFSAPSRLLPSPFIPLYPPLPLPPLSPSGGHHTVVCVYEVGLFFVFFFCLVPSPVLPKPQTLFPLTAVSLFSVLINLFLFCLLAYFVH